MSRDTRTQLLAAIVMLVCMGVSAALAINLTGIAGRNKLAYTDRAEAGQPAEVSAGIAMGAFRGIFVNFLWMRANDMKQEGKFFEAIQLADAITRLQPRFPRVWVFHAWNMSYNISVETKTRDERWKWVNEGIRLLRDKGIPANPNDMLIHKELAWIYLHKIGGYTDDANAYYKRRLAQEWTVVLGPPPPRTPEDNDRTKAIAKYVAWLRQYATAPDTIDQAVAKEPAIAVLLEQLAISGVPLDPTLLGRYEVWKASAKSSQKEYFRRVMAGEKMKVIGALADDPKHAAAWTALLAHLRKRILIDAYHMEPDRMIRYTEKFGPMDWRHHGAHAVYWGQKGVEGGLSRKTDLNRRDYDFVNTDRVVAQGVQELFRSGELYFDFFSSSIPNRYALWQGVPNPHFVEPYGMIIDEQRTRSEIDRLDNRGYTPLSAGYENFLKDAICFFYRRGDKLTARKWQEKLITYYGMNVVGSLQAYDVALPLDEFVAAELKTRATSPYIAVQSIAGSLIGAYTSGLMGGDMPLFASQFEYGKQAHRYFMEEQRRRTQVDAQYRRMDQIDPDFRVVAGALFATFMEGIGLDEAEQVFDRAPPDLACWAYDMLRQRYKSELDKLVAESGPNSGARSFEAIFAEPPGIEEHRAEMARLEAERSREGPKLESQ